MKKNKRAAIDILGPHTFDIIVGILCTLVIIAAIISIVGIKQKSEIKKQATSLLSETIALMNGLKNVGESTQLTIANLQGWYYVSFKGEKKPSKCLENNCLCLCQQTIINSCESDGVCRFPYDVTIMRPQGPVGSIEITSPTTGEDVKKSAITIKKIGEKKYQINYKSENEQIKGPEIITA